MREIVNELEFRDLPDCLDAYAVTVVPGHSSVRAFGLVCERWGFSHRPDVDFEATTRPGLCERTAGHTLGRDRLWYSQAAEFMRLTKNAPRLGDGRISYAR